MNKRLCLAIVGPTASGKSELAVRIAKQIHYGEIISADSRQVYKGMDIGSGKVAGTWLRNTSRNLPVYTYKTIPHYLIDEVSPASQYSVTQFQTKAALCLNDILNRDLIPIVCGGTGLWIDALLYNHTFPRVQPNEALREKLKHTAVDDLFTQLERLDPDRAASIDAKNPRRLIRALEIILTTGKPVPQKRQDSLNDILWIGINPGEEILQANIIKRLDERLQAGMIAEVQKLHDQKISWKRLELFGLEYKFCAWYLQGKLTFPEMKEQLTKAIRHYAKRQMTWWKRNKDIHWFENAHDATQYTASMLKEKSHKN